MKKLLCLFLIAAMACVLSGCDNPDSLQLDLSRGYGEHLKLIHLNASTEEKRERIEAFGEAIRSAEPLEKELSLFAYYPDYRLEITPWEDGETLTAIVDINGDFVDFYFPGPYPEKSAVLYRSQTTAEEFKKLVHHA